MTTESVEVLHQRIASLVSRVMELESERDVLLARLEEITGQDQDLFTCRGCVHLRGATCRVRNVGVTAANRACILFDSKPSEHIQ